MAVGIELPKHYLKKEWLTMTMLLFPIMVFMWLMSGLFIWGLIPTINYLEALVISACICPTDPILANSVVKGRFAEKYVPTHIRNALSAESGANDGMGFPFLFLAIFLISEEDIGTAIGKWIYITCLFQIVLSCIIGVVVGYGAKKILQWSLNKNLIDKPSFLAFAIALALFLMSMTGFSGSDDLLACFVAGNALSWDDWFRNETEQAHFQEVIDMMLNLAIFVYIGAMIPWSDFQNPVLGLTPWRLISIAILVLFFRRLPIVLLLKPVMPAIKTYREAIFTGWFGPMGVGAIFLSIIAKEELENVYEGKNPPISIKVISPVVLFIVFCSIIVHGTTIPLFQLGRRIRTRSLSLTSLSNALNTRIPKSQSDHAKRPIDHRYSKDVASLTELQRNTLFNTIQHDVFKEQRKTAITIKVTKPTESVSEIKDEDLLFDDMTNGSEPSPAFRKTVTESKRNDPCGSSVISFDTQHAIRFIEPVKQPRYSTIQKDKSDTSLSSIKSWIFRANKEEQKDNEMSSLKNSPLGLFRKSKDNTDSQSSASNQEEMRQINSTHSLPNVPTYHSSRNRSNCSQPENAREEMIEIVVDESNQGKGMGRSKR
ncbi:Sodium/hydrogen exchanger family-domain-containing protein [Pilobolus umbonatus]|nr:Sodium/hydrogen exchanger family-domain-containing protein [Pilobolus umbonatus]